MKISFKTQPQLGEWSQLEAIWRAADEMPEIGAGWLFDHFYPIFSERPDGPCYEGWTALSYLAAATSRLCFGLIVSANPYRHPALLAEDLRDARRDVGRPPRDRLGAGWNQEEVDAYGLPFPSVGQRMDALEEACQVIDSLLTQPVTNFQGVHYQLTNANREPNNQVAAPRIMIAVRARSGRCASSPSTPTIGTSPARPATSSAQACGAAPTMRRGRTGSFHDRGLRPPVPAARSGRGGRPGARPPGRRLRPRDHLPGGALLIDELRRVAGALAAAVG